MTEHRVIAQQALGHSLPEAAVVHHVNGDKHDNRQCNLVICEDENYHKLLHRRMRILAAGGNPNTDKICGRCRVPLPVSMFSSNRSAFDGRASMCKPCHAADRTAKRGPKLGRIRCRKGHLFTPENTKLIGSKKFKRCLICHVARRDRINQIQREYYRRSCRVAINA